jgi:hypothetical protein
MQCCDKKKTSGLGTQVFCPPFRYRLGRFCGVEQATRSFVWNIWKMATSFKQGAASTWRAVRDIFDEDVRPPRPDELERLVGTGQTALPAQFTVDTGLSIFVKVLSARGLLAMDTNNLSDPYAVVKLSGAVGHKHVTRVCRKTLAPVFDETFVFDTEEVRAAVTVESPHISVILMDWDQFSRDDFMGIGTVALSEVLGGRVDAPVSISLPLFGFKGRGKKRTCVDCGVVHLSVWVHASGGETMGVVTEVPSRVMDFSRQLGFRGAPRVLHGRIDSSVCIEEPYLVALCLNLEQVCIATDDDPMMPRSVRASRTLATMRSQAASRKYREDLRRKRAADAMGMGEDEELYEDLDLDEDGDDDSSGVGSFAYFRVTLGSGTTKTSHLVRQQGDTVPVNDQIPFLLPTPVPDGQVQLVLYRTHTSKAGGVATHVCLVDVYDLLVDMEGLQKADVDLKTTVRRLTLKLTPLKKKFEAATLTVKVTLADMDFRRRLYGVGLMATSTQRTGWADPRVAVSAINQDLTTRLSEADILELESRTDADYQSYRIQKAALDAQKERVGVFVRGAVERQIEKVEKVVGLDFVHGRQVVSKADGEENIEGDEDDDEDAAGREIIGRLSVALEALTAKTTLPHAHVVFSVEQTWFRTGDVAVSATEQQIEGFAVSCPVVSPGAMFSACLVSKSRKKDSKEVTRGAFAVQGVLRFCLSSLQCGKTTTCTLPFLSSRDKGGKVVGSARLAIRLDYPSLKAQVRGFGRPEFPQECYVHMINMESLQRERRELLLDWMRSINPPISTEAVMAITRADCEEFSISRLKANLRRIRIALKGLRRLKTHFDLLASWRRPNISRVGLVGAVFTAYYPSIAFSMLAGYLAVILYQEMPSSYAPDDMEDDGVGLDLLDTTKKDEMETGLELQVVGVGVVSNLRSKWADIRGILLMVQDRMDSMANGIERLESLIEWKAPLVSAMFLVAILVVGLLIFTVGLRPIMAGLLCFIIRPPRMRSPWPPGPIASFLKVPKRGDTWS